MSSSSPDQANHSWARAAWLFPLACLIHNGEEILWMAPWSRHVGHGIPPMGAFELAWMALIMTALAYGTTYLALYVGCAWVYVNAAYWVAMLVNVILPHTLISIVEGGYTPGLGTVLLVILPVCWHLTRRALREGRIEARRLALTSLAVVPAIFGLCEVLLRLGQQMYVVS